jgi:hypothetical protein
MTYVRWRPYRGTSRRRWVVKCGRRRSWGRCRARCCPRSWRHSGVGNDGLVKMVGSHRLLGREWRTGAQDARAGWPERHAPGLIQARPRVIGRGPWSTQRWASRTPSGTPLVAPAPPPPPPPRGTAPACITLLNNQIWESKIMISWWPLASLTWCGLFE